MRMDIPEELMIEQDWRELAACRQHDAGLFFPANDEEGEQVERAKAICSGCPVRQECLTYAIETRQAYGIWGGHTPKERRKIRKRWVEAA